jgi:hypothetical protein
MNTEKQTNKHPGYKRWVFVFLIFGVLVHGGVFFLFTVDFDEPPEQADSTSFVVFQPEDLPLASDELEQRAYLFDSEPIFLPTARNYSGPIKTDASVWEPEVTLSAAFPPDIRLDESILVVDSGVDNDSGNPLDILQPVSRDFISEFAASKPDSLTAIRRGLFVEAKTSLGAIVLKKFIELEDSVMLDFPSNPAEFSVLHTDFGIAGMPLLVNPSGSEETDNYVREFILEKVHPLLVGTTGYFHIRIGL